MKKKTRWWIALAILSVALTGFFGFAIKTYRSYQSIPSDPLIGNRTSCVKDLKEKGFPFSFLVIGDTHSSERAKRLIQLALRNENPSFMVILGDFVMEPDRWDHRFFLMQMTKEIKPTFPVFLVSGNHDIDYTSTKIRNPERSVTPEIYESLYGPTNFNFVYNNCLFIICGIDAKNPTHYLDYLRDVLSQKRAGKKHIFVFSHLPPKGLADYIEGPLPNGEEFLSILEKYKVTTCFFGDFHGYWRGQREGVNLIVSGGGGRIKESQPVWGRFHHLLNVTVDENRVSEGLIVLPGEARSFGGTLEKGIVVHLFPMVQERGWALYVLFIFFLFWSIYFVKISFHQFRKARQ
jgi:Icc-related predicted phosphoesterase